MTFYLIGIDHKTAPVSVRELVYRKRREIAAFWGANQEAGAVTLSTCNRFEAYGITGDAAVAKYIECFLGRFGEFAEYGYIKTGKDKIYAHLLRLAAGLESQIKAETQILWQLESWLDKRAFPPQLAGLVSAAITAGRKIRSLAGLSGPENNIAVLVYDDIGRLFPAERKINIVVAGTGKIAGLFAEYRPGWAGLHFAAHKNYGRAQELANFAAGKAISFKELPEALLMADVLVSATSSPHIVFDRGYISGIAALRKEKLHIYDLAVPRDVESGAAGIEGVGLKNIDDINVIFTEHNSKLRHNIELAEDLIKNRHKAQPVSA